MRTLLRLATIAVLASGVFFLYNSPQYHDQFNALWQEITTRLGDLQGAVSSRVGYGPISNLGPKQVSVSVPRSQAKDWQTVGSLGPEILAGSTSLKIEIDGTTQSAPTAADLSTIRQVLSRYSGKTVTFATGDTNLPISADYDLATIVKLTQDHRGCFTTSTQVCIYLMYLPGSFEHSSALGLSYASSAIVIMSDQLNRGANPFVSRDRVATATLTHEIGHLFGLVNLIGQEVRPHEDQDHPGHSNNPRSVMYWAVEDLSVNSILSGGPAISFDADDEADIKLIGGK